MKWAHFLHMYQPWWQHPGILEKIVNESYRPLIRGFLKTPNTKITININSVLTEMLFNNGYRDVIDDLKLLIEMGRVELTGSAKYHAFLPLIPEHEVIRQIKLNHDTNKSYFGDLYKPKGFFPPEMGYSPAMAKVVEDLGYEWILIDEVSFKDPTMDSAFDKVHFIKGTNLNVYFREKKPSNLIMAALVRSKESLLESYRNRLKDNSYTITAMDAETFGHHRPGHDNFLVELFNASEFENIFISEIPKHFKEKDAVIPNDSSWASSWKDIHAGNPYCYWFDKTNKIHSLQWELAGLAIKAVNESEFSDEKYPHMLEELHKWEHLNDEQKQNEEKKREWVNCRDLLDKGLNSDPWWWACAIPWWSIEEIEKGMNTLLKIVSMIPDAKEADRKRANELYINILVLAHEWQRTGYVDKLRGEDQKTRTIPLSKRFAAAHYYEAFIKALGEEELSSAKKREYEQAIKWRDAQYKLERDLDIYDAVHAVDIFRKEGNFERFQEILAEYQKKYREISKGQPEK
ncbi:MAG: hypothetical protein E6Q58_02515 [Niabella sp.]|nr:MAG: hypothetical protein E6Q58_02515 [Niabella sp.]